MNTEKEGGEDWGSAGAPPYRWARIAGGIREGERPRETPSLGIRSDAGQVRDSRGRSPSRSYGRCLFGGTSSTSPRSCYPPVFNPWLRGCADLFHPGFGGGFLVDLDEGPGRLVAHRLVLIG